MPTNALLKTNTSGTWNSSTGFSYSTIPTITGIAHKDQIEVERKFTVPSGTVLVQEDFRKIFVIASNNYTLDEANKKITAFSASFPNYVTKAGVSITVPAVSNGDSITIRRKSISSESLVTWLDGTRLTASQLNLQTSQLVNLAQEILDRLNYEFVTATDLEYNSTYSTATRTWVEGRLGALPSGQSAKTYIDAADTNIQSQVDSAVAINTTQNGRLDAIETLNTSQTSSINALTPRVSPSTSLTGTYSASNLSAAVNGLDTRVTATESTNTSQGSAITALQTKVGAGTITGTIVANGSDIITAVNAIDDYVTSAVTTSSNTIFNGHAQGRIVYAGANGTKDSTANFTITPSSTSPTVLTLAGNLSQTGNQNITGNLTQVGVLNLTGNTTSVLNLTGTFTVNADSATVPTFKGASTQKIVAFKNSSNVEVNAIDQYGNLIGRATATYGSSSPTNPLAGTIWYDSANTSFKIYNGSAWTQISTTTLANYVGLSGNETVAGNKTFSDNIGIGGANSTGNKLLVTSAATNTGLQVLNGLVRVDNNGSVGLQSLILAGNGSNLQVSHEANSLLTLTNSGTTGGGFQFKGSSTAALTINSSGNVGIGTSSPATKLHVSGSSSTTEQIYLNNSNSNSYGTFSIAGGTGVPGSGVPANSVWFEGVPASSGNTYLSSYNNNLAFATGSSRLERMRIDSSGNIGIGMTPTTRTLSIYNSTAPTLQLANSTTGTNATNGGIIWMSGNDMLINNQQSANLKLETNGSTRLTIDSSGNVGIGTTSPGYKLSILSASGLSGFASDGTVQQAFAYPSNTAAWSGTISDHAYVLMTNNTERMRILNTGNVGIGTTSPTKKLEVAVSSNSLQIVSAIRNAQAGTGVAAIGFNVSDTSEPHSTKAGIGLLRESINGVGSLCFYNNSNSSTSGDFTTSNERMRIDTNGNLILGNVNAAGNTTRNLDIYNYATGASAASIIRLITHNTTGSPSSIGQLLKYQTGGFAIQNTDTNAAAHMSFWVGSTENMRIDSSGNIGINTASPTTKLDVNGTTSISGITTLSSTQAATASNTGALQVGGGVGVGGNLYAAGKVVAPTIEAGIIQSTGTLEFRGDYDAALGSNPDMTIKSDGVVEFTKQPMYTQFPLIYTEFSNEAQLSSATSGFRFATGFVSYNNLTYPVRYTKTGRMVFVEGLISAATANTTLGSTVPILQGLPAPAYQQIFITAGRLNNVVGTTITNYSGTFETRVLTDGTLRVWGFSGDGQTTQAVASLNTSASNWLALSFVYLAA